MTLKASFWISRLPVPQLNKNLVNIQAHEIAHQWFGNLVTCKWWNHLWLNEGFATYFAHYGVNAFSQDFDTFNVQTLIELRLAMKSDVSDNSVPVSYDIKNPRYVFVNREIIYRKASSIIRMVAASMSETAFLKSIESYLMHFSISNVGATQFVQFPRPSR